jgi:hypothetical protein
MTVSLCALGVLSGERLFDTGKSMVTVSVRVSFT